MVETIKKKINQKRNKIGERERVLTFLSWITWKKIGERGVSEVIKKKFI